MTVQPCRGLYKKSDKAVVPHAVRGGAFLVFPRHRRAVATTRIQPRTPLLWSRVILLAFATQQWNFSARYSPLLWISHYPQCLLFFPALDFRMNCSANAMNLGTQNGSVRTENNGRLHPHTRACGVRVSTMDYYSRRARRLQCRASEILKGVGVFYARPSNPCGTCQSTC